MISFKEIKCMNKTEKQILDEYIRDYNVSDMSYKLMGIMLDEKYVEKRLKLFNINEMYIYGGSYMAVQLYQIGKKYTIIKDVVDKSGQVVLSHLISVITLDELRKKYNGEKILIASVRFFQEIKEDLELFVSTKDIVGIGELLMGIVEEE